MVGDSEPSLASPPPGVWGHSTDDPARAFGVADQDPTLHEYPSLCRVSAPLVAIFCAPVLE
jgi:hypothetical protein